MTDPNRRADEGAPVDVNESFDESIDESIDVEGQTDTEQVTHAQEGQDEYDDPAENALNDPERSATTEHAEP